MPKITERGPSNNLTGLGVTRAASRPVGTPLPSAGQGTDVPGAIDKAHSPTWAPPPARSATKAEWAAYVVDVLGFDPADVAGMTKTELRGLV